MVAGAIDSSWSCGKSWSVVLLVDWSAACDGEAVEEVRCPRQLTYLWSGPWASRHLAIVLGPVDSCPLYSRTWPAGF